MIKTEVKYALKNTTLGRFLSADETDTLIAHSKLITFAPGEFIMQQGKLSQGMYVVMGGTALATAKILGEGGTYITTLGYGNLIGEIGLIEACPSAISVIASTQVQCLLMTNHYFEVLDFVFPETKYKIACAVAREVYERLIDLHNKIASFMQQSAMTSRTMFSEVIRSLTHMTIIDFAEINLHLDEIAADPLFHNFCEREFKQLVSHTQTIKAPKNCTLIEVSEIEPVCFILLRGAVQSSIINDNKVAKVSVLGPISLFCNMTDMGEALPSIINFASCERAILWKIDKQGLHDIQTNHQLLWFKLFELMCRSIVNLEHAADKLNIRLNSELYNR